MNINIVSTTELQRNIKKVLEKLNSSTEPLVVVRDSQPEAVMVPYAEFKRLSEIEKEMLRKRMEEVWERMRKKNAKVSLKEIDKVIEETKKYANKIDYSWWNEIQGSITIGDKNKKVRISENVDEIYYR